MLSSYNVVSSRCLSQAPANTGKSAEDQYYESYVNAVISWPFPQVSTARIRHALAAAKQAFVTFQPAGNT